MADYPLGATPLPPPHTGAHFKVWAPHAESVTVLLQPPSSAWNRQAPTTRVDLATTTDGYWEADVSSVVVGSIYRLELTHGPSVFQRLDPAARDTITSWASLMVGDNHNAGIVVTREAYAYAPFTTPPFDQFIIYQLHIGSFAGRGDGLNKPIANFRDVEAKFDYIVDLGFNAIELLPVQEFQSDRSWGYNPALFFAPESAYGHPGDLKQFVDAAHRKGLAVIFDVVYNHAGPDDNSLWVFDGHPQGGGIYFEGGQPTPWGTGPAWHQPQVRQFFYENARMYFEDYNADGLRFDATTFMNGNDLALVVGRLVHEFPGKYIVAEHLPNHPWITTSGNFRATWTEAHHEFQRAMVGNNPVERVRHLAGWDGYHHPWNLVNSLLGSHDDIGDQENGDAEGGMHQWDRAHRYLVDLVGGRDNWFARAKCRLGWALNIGIAGTPMCFMGSECLLSSPDMAWGYWHDGFDMRGDHRFHWGAAETPAALEMRRLVRDCNLIRRSHPALRQPGLAVPHEDHRNQVIGIKRWDPQTGQVVMVIVNMGDANFLNRNYGVETGGQSGQWTQILCTQDASYGGWDGAGNAYYEPWTQSDGRLYINLPQWSVVMMRLLAANERQ